MIDHHKIYFFVNLMPVVATKVVPTAKSLEEGAVLCCRSSWRVVSPNKPMLTSLDGFLFLH